jgi:hypothetical protein
VNWGNVRNCIEYIEAHTGIVPVSALYGDEREDSEEGDNERWVTIIACEISYRARGSNTYLPRSPS